MKESILEVKNLHFAYDEHHTVLDGISLSVFAGERIAILGSNGAGKSTLFNAITGAFFADKGLIMLDGEDITYQKEHVRSKVIGHLFQDPLKGTAPHMTIEENAALRRAVERCRVRSGGIDPDVLLNAIRGPREYKQRYVVRFNDRIVPVQTTDIAYFYSEEKNTYLVTSDNNRYVVDQSLDVLSDELDPGRFFRISRSCIIAMPAIVSIVKYLGNRLKITARPRPEFEMVVSRSRVDDFLKWLEGNG